MNLLGKVFLACVAWIWITGVAGCREEYSDRVEHKLDRLLATTADSTTTYVLLDPRTQPIGLPEAGTVSRVQIGACVYVVVRSDGDGVAIVHAGDCPNHDAMRMVYQPRVQLP